MAEFELWLEMRAWNALRRARPHMGEDEYRQARNDLNREIAAGQYGKGSPACLEAMNSPDGQKQIMFLMLQPKYPNEARSLVEQMATDPSDEVADAVDATLTIGEPDPNRVAPPRVAGA